MHQRTALTTCKLRVTALLVPCSVALLLSCGHPKKLAVAELRVMDTIKVSANNNPNEIYRATTPRAWEIINTTLTLRFDLAKKEATGSARLSIMPYAVAQDTLLLDAKSMEIKSVGVKDAGSEQVSPLPYHYEADQLKVNVRNLSFGNLVSRRQQTICIEYVAKPYASATGGSTAITEDRGLYFINTDHAIPGKPVQIWTQGETESNSHWMPTIDKPNQRSTFAISLIVPDSMQTLSNGRLVSSTPAGPGLRKDEWQMPQPIQIYAAMFAIGRFEITKDEWKDASGLPHEVSYYTEPGFAPYARGMFRHTPEMMTLFSKVTGVSYPWNKYSQVVVRDYVSGAMENTTASLFGEFANKNSRQLLDESNEDVVAHELFHQWFGDYVTAESWSNLTVNESFATYGTLVWRMHKYGKASADEQAYSDLLSYLGAAQFNDPPLVRYHYRSREDLFDRISYQKGAVILRYIHSLVGDTLFSRAMEHYLRQNALGSAEAADWRKALEHVTGKDWNPFFNQWYYRGGHPVLSVKYDYNTQARKLTITARQKSFPDSSYLYNLPLKVAVIYGPGNMRVEDWTISARSQSLTYDLDASGKFPVVIVDAGHLLPGTIREDKTLEVWQRQLELTDDYISKVLAINAAFNSETNSLSPSLVSRALDDTTRGIRLYALRRLERVTRPAWKEVLLPKVKLMMQTSGDNKVRGTAMSVLGAWKEKSELPALVAAVSDSSYFVSGLALGALMDIDPDTAYALANEVLKHNPKSSLQGAAWTAIVSKGAPADMARFQASALRVYGAEKVALANNLQRYAMEVKDNALYERALALLVEMAKNEAIRGYRLAIGSNVYEMVRAYRKNGSATRLELAQQYAAKVLSAEPDADNIARYKAMNQ